MLLGFTCDEATSIQYHKGGNTHYREVKQFDNKKSFHFFTIVEILKW